MGAWGFGNFENDDAMDFVGDLETTTGTGHLSNVLSLIHDERSEYVEAPIASAALAADEVVAALRGHPDPAHPEEVTRWVAQQTGSDEDLALDAVRAVERIAENCELRELVEEGDDHRR